MRARAGRLIFWRPALFTLLLHGLLLWVMTVNWTSADDSVVKPRPTPRFIQARLIEVEPPKQKQAAAKPAAASPKPRPKPKPKPKPKPVPKPAAPKPAEPKPEPKPEPQPAEPTREERAEAARDELALAMEVEDQALEAAVKWSDALTVARE